MSISEKLTSIKTKLTSLLAYANQKTGKSDTDIGTAIKTLCDGYGSGDGTEAFPYSGKNPVLINTFTETYHMSDTSFDPTTTYTGSAQTILTGTSNKYTASVNMSKYDYVVVQRIKIDIDYDDDVTVTPRMLNGATATISYFVRRRNKPSDSSNRGYTVVQTATPSAVTSYYNTSNTLLYGLGTSYGIYPTLSAPTISSTTSSTPTIKITTPTESVRTSSVFTLADGLKAIKDFTIVWETLIYQVDVNSTVASQWLENTFGTTY